MKSLLTINEIKEVVRSLSRNYGVESVYLFGSYAKGNATEYSDIDLRIDRGQLKGLFQLSGFSMDLEESFNKKVDVLTTESLDEDFLRRIQSEEIKIYEN